MRYVICHITEIALGSWRLYRTAQIEAKIAQDKKHDDKNNNGLYHALIIPPPEKELQEWKWIQVGL